MNQSYRGSQKVKVIAFLLIVTLFLSVVPQSALAEINALWSESGSQEAGFMVEKNAGLTEALSIEDAAATTVTTDASATLDIDDTAVTTDSAATFIIEDMTGTSVTTDALWSMSESYNQLDEKTKKIALEYLDTVKKLKTFSDATEEERMLICNYLNIDFDVLLKAEAKGYSIADGLRIAVMVSKGDISFEEIEAGLAHYESVMALDSAIKNYSNVVRLNAFEEKTVTSIKKRVLDGSNAYDLQKPARVSEAFNVALESIINNANQERLDELKPETLSTEATEEMAKLSQFAFENDLSLSWVKQYAKEKQLDSEALKSGLNDYLGIPPEEALISDSKATEALEAEEPFVSVASTEEPEEDKFRAPYSYEEYSEDKIEMNTGNLVFENKDIYLPGKNGLDFTLISRYNSENDRKGEEEIIEGVGYNKLYNVRIMFDVANNGLILYKNQVRSTKTGLTQEEYERLLDIYNNVDYDDQITYEADYDGDGSIDHFVFWLQEISQTENPGSSVYVQTSYYTPTYSQKDSPLGTGWGFAFDSIELPTDESHAIIPLGKTAYRIKKFDGVKYLHLKSGETYTIGSNLELEGYNLSDMHLEQSTSYTNGQDIRSAYVLVYKDGLRKYFANDGRFLAEVDRYGNRIEYQHTLIEGHPVITKIIDSLNRVVTIYYDFSNNRVVVTAPDNKTITYVLSLSPGEYIKSPRDHSLIYTYSYTLSKRVDSENQKISFEYGYTADLSYTMAYAVADRSKTILSKITYPTGAYVQYYYGNSKRFLPGGGQENYPGVRKRLIYEPKNKIKNETFYIYTNNYTRYPYTYDEKDEYQLRARFPETYGFTEYDKNLEANMCYAHTFDYKNLLTSEETYRTYLTGGDGDFYKYAEKYYLYDTISYKYGNDHQLLQRLTKTYTVPPEVGMTQDTSKSLTSVEDFSFDNSRNLVKYWGPEAVRDGNNQLTNPNGDSQLVTYIYDTGGYHLVTSKQYKKDASSTLLETYGLTSDKKAVSSVTIKQNGVQKSKTAYAYDQWGNVTSKRQYLEGGGSWTEYLEELYSYADDNTARNGQFNGGYLTRKWTVGVKDADGTLVAARSGLSAGTVDYRYSYDNYGRVIESYDGQGEKTTQQYDSLGRVVSLQNPDGAQKLYGYDNTNNILTVTDENGNQFQYLYDGLGNLLYEKDTATGKYLKTYKYNARLLLEEETNNKNGANYYKIQYTYYDDGRIKRTETRDKNDAVMSVETMGYFGAYDGDGNGTPDCSLVVKTTEGEDTAPSIVAKTYTDRLGRVVKASTVHNGQEYQNTATYDYLGNKLSEKSARAYAEGWSESSTARYEYDYAGRVTKTYNVSGDYATAAYDALGRKITVTDIKGNKASTPYSTTYTYDSLGRVLSEQIPFEDVSGTLSYTLKKYYYDRNNNLLTSKISNSLPGQTLTYSKTGYGYDKRNRLVQVTAYNGDTPENYTQYYYDAAGNKLRMYTGLSQPLTISGPDTATGSDTDYSVTKYAYDRSGQLIEMTDPLGQKETYTYDLNGNQTAKTDRNGNVFAFSYDGLGRLTAKSVATPDGKGNASYSYAYNKLGQMKNMADGATSTSYVYDDFGRVVKETGSDGITKEYTYDAENNRKTLVIKNNGTTVKNAAYTYDKFNRLSQVSEDGQVHATYTYDANGNRLTLSYSNGNVTEYQYNLSNQLKLLTNKRSGATLSSYAYTYYLNGNQATKTDHSGKITSYTYDGLGRLTGEAPQDELSVFYTYDDYNNRKTMTTGNDITVYDYNKNNQLKEEGKTTVNYTFKYDYSQNLAWTWHGFDIPVDTNTDYTYSFDAFISEDANVSSVGRTFIANGEAGFNTTFSYDNTKKGTWQHFEVTMKPNDSQARILLYPTGESIPATTGYILYKNVQFRKAGASTNLFPQPSDNSEFTVKGSGIVESLVSDYIFKYDYSQNLTWTWHGFDIPVDTNTDYTYSFDAFISEDANISSVGSTFIANGEAGFNTTFSYDNTKKGTWQHFEVTMKPNDSRARILLYPTGESIPATTGYILYKNVKFTKVGTSHNLFPQVSTNSEFSVKGAGIVTSIPDGDKQEISYYGYDNNGNQVYREKESLSSAADGVEETSSAMANRKDSIDLILSEYDGLNQLKKVVIGNSLIEYSYNSEGLRVSKTINGNTVTHVWDGKQIVLELDNQRQILQRYVRGINLIYAEDKSKDKKYYLFNGHGDVVQLTNSSANVVKLYKYDAFGNEIQERVGQFEIAQQSRGRLVEVIQPDTGKEVKALKLEKGASVPTFSSTVLSLKPNKSYIIEFDYWTDSGQVAFNCDLYPDDLPEIHPVATTAVQHYRWEINSASANMEKAVLRFFNDLNKPNPENIYISNISIRENLVGGSTEIGVFEKANKTGTSIVDVVKPDTGKTVKAIRLNSGSNIPTIWTDALNLVPYETYVVEFDYWTESGEVVFDCDLYPDDLPQVFPVATTTVQHYKWEMSSSSSNMANAKLRFFNDLKATNPSHIYITNIKLYVKSTELKDSNPYRYSGEYFDKETGTIYLRVRYYDPGIGRFISEDSFLGNNSDPLSLNLYTYCYNNPVRLIDPDGTSPLTWLTGVTRGIDEDYFFGIGLGLHNAFRYIFTGEILEKNTLLWYLNNDEDFATGYYATKKVDLVIGVISLAGGLKKIITTRGAALIGANGELISVISGSAEGVMSAVGAAGIVLNASRDLGESKRRPEKGKEFRGGSKNQRDKWFGYDKDKDFVNWWHRKGKEEFGGDDIQDKNMAKEAYEYWIELGKPKMK